MTTFITSVNIKLEVIGRATRQEREIKASKLEKKDIAPLYLDNLILYVKTPEDFTKTFDLIKQFSKV